MTLITPKSISYGYAYRYAYKTSVKHYLDTEFRHDPNSVEWLETPVHWSEFVESDAHLGMFKLTPRQSEMFEYMFGNDPKTMWFNNNDLAVLLYGKGSGKDAVAAIAELYGTYTLLCTDIPQKLFGLSSTANLDIINVAPSAENASLVYFDALRKSINNWTWLKKKYKVKSSGVVSSQFDVSAYTESVVVTKDGVMFPKNIRLHARNSNNESTEGFNTLMWVMDEASAFKTSNGSNNADKIYKSLKSSSITRFANRGKGFVLSYPRYEGDFTYNLYLANRGRLHSFADTGPTWEIAPRKRFSNETFQFEGWSIPITFKEEFDSNPTDAKMKYLAIPPKAEHGFIEYPEKIEACITKDRHPLVEFDSYFDADGLVCKRIKKFYAVNMIYSYILTIDLGRKSDKAALSVLHIESLSDEQYAIVQDVCTFWKPEVAGRHEVSFTNVLDIIKSMNTRIPLAGVWFDQWQSIYMQEALGKAGIPAFLYYLNNDDYKKFKELAYGKRLVLLDVPEQTKEIVSLIETKTRVDHPTTGSKDIADTVVGGIRVLLDKNRFTNNSKYPDVEPLTNNLHDPEAGIYDFSK